MTTDPACCQPQTPVNEIAQLMREHNCGEIPVTGADNRLVGVVTDRDIVVRVVAAGKNPSGCTAEECMTTSPVTVRLDDSLSVAIEAMEKHQIRRVPVVDGDGKCVGIIAQADVARDAEPRQTGELVKEVSG